MVMQLQAWPVGIRWNGHRPGRTAQGAYAADDRGAKVCKKVGSGPALVGAELRAGGGDAGGACCLELSGHGSVPCGATNTTVVTGTTGARSQEPMRIT